MEGDVRFCPGKIQFEDTVEIVEIAGITNERTARGSEMHVLTKNKIY